MTQVSFLMCAFQIENTDTSESHIVLSNKLGAKSLHLLSTISDNAQEAGPGSIMYISAQCESEGTCITRCNREHSRCYQCVRTPCIIKCTYTTSPDIVDPRLSRSRPHLSRLFHNMRLTPRHWDPILPPTLIITAGIATL